MRPITEDLFNIRLAKNPYLKGRWGYMKIAIGMAMECNPKTVLELGSRGTSIFLDSHTMDISPESSPLILWDARKTPWPKLLPDGHKYDVFVALQTWEHLSPSQHAAFQEVKRVSKSAVLSFPLEWKRNPRDLVHYNITRSKIIQDWIGEEPASEVIDHPGSPYKRIVMRWEWPC
jgi:hypothetical protein